LSQNPSSFFGNLLRGCIRDSYVDDGDTFRESVILTILGVGSSFLTVYALSLLRLFV
jgi:hypothetical protein